MGSTPASDLPQKERPPGGWSFFLEQGTGVEPASEAWEGRIIPIYQSRKYLLSVTNSMTFSEIPFLKSEKSLRHRDFQSGSTLAWEATIIADILTLHVGVL